MSYYIYKVTSPSDKVYIGITKNYADRKRKHKNNMKSNQPRIKRRKFVRACKKYGWDNMIFEHIFCAFNEKLAKDIEIELIKKFNSYDKGYNMTLGGDFAATKDLSVKDLDEIRVLLEATTESLAKIATKYGLHASQVLSVQRNEAYIGMGNSREIKRPGNTYAKGENTGNSKLTDDLVRDIKLSHMKGKNSPELAKIFNVSKANICHILKEETWKHVKVEGYKRRKSRGNSKLQESDVREIWDLYSKDVTIPKIASKLNFKYATVRSILKGLNWKDIYKEFN